jgi:hypothetical protein
MEMNIKSEFFDVTILENKLSKTYVEETKNSGQVYRLYFTKKQIDKILQILTDELNQPKMNSKVEVKDLVGKHYLSGFDTATEKADNSYNSYNEDFDVVRFVLDGRTYKAIEDPSDGYRSYLQDLIVTDEVISNTFPPQEVIGIMKENDNYSVNDTIQFFDIVTGKIVLEIGTDNTDDYYPYCVMNWYPENLAINVDK